MSRLVSLGDVAVLLSRVLPLSWMYRLARLEGRLVYRLRPARRRVVERNLAPFAKDASELKEMTRKFFELKQVRTLMMLVFMDTDPEEWEEHLELEGLEHLDSALSQGRGAIFLASHLNSIGVFMAVMILRKRGYDVRVALPSPDELFPATRLGKVVRRRSASPTLMEHIGGFYVQFNVRPIIKALAENAIIGQTGDGWHSAAFTSVPFLGRSLPFTTGMMSVAQSTGTMIVPASIVGEAPKLRCRIASPFGVPKSADPRADLDEAVAKFAKVLERDLLDNVVCWEHWLFEDTLDTMATWPQRPLRERLEL